MAHEKIFAELSDPTWSVPHPTDQPSGGDDIPPRESLPGGVIQWHDDNETVALATGDLALDGATDPDLPTFDLAGYLGEVHATPEEVERVNAAVKLAIDQAWQIGVATPRYVWFSRKNLNQWIRAIRRARTAAHGVDE